MFDTALALGKKGMADCVSGNLGLNEKILKWVVVIVVNKRASCYFLLRFLLLLLGEFSRLY